MQIKLNDQGFIDSFATIGNILNGTEIEIPADLDHFERNYRAYRIKDGTLFFDADKASAIQTEEENEQLRVERDKECFTVINRGWLWYDTLSEKQTKELRKWYQDWLDVTDTRKKPDRPSWLK